MLSLSTQGSLVSWGMEYDILVMKETRVYASPKLEYYMVMDYQKLIEQSKLQVALL